MTEKYEVNAHVRIINKIMSQLIRWDLAPKQIHLLTVMGRKTGNPYTLPVSLVMKDGNRWLVSPYGETNWLKNARTRGEVVISRGKRKQSWKLQELGPEDSAPILKEYLQLEKIVQPYFEVEPDSSLMEFERIASNHPVFLLKGFAD